MQIVPLNFKLCEASTRMYVGMDYGMVLLEAIKDNGLDKSVYVIDEGHIIERTAGQDDKFFGTIDSGGGIHVVVAII